MKKRIIRKSIMATLSRWQTSMEFPLIICWCRTENREQINTPLTELHLNDEMVALLKRFVLWLFS